MTTWQRLGHGHRERSLCLAMNRWGARRWSTVLFRGASRLGDGPAWYALIAALALFGGLRGRHAAVQMIGIGVVSALLYKALKHWTRRPRPFRAHADITALIAPLDEFSFPSGHTLHAVGFSLVACAYFPALSPLLAAFTVLVALSRVVLGLHYPSDVLAAIAIGCALAWASFLLVPTGWLIG